MAEVYFNTHNSNPNLEAISAGTSLKWDGKINPKVVELLLSKWINIFAQSKKYEPKNLQGSVLENAHKICTMWCMEWWCFVWDREVDFDFWLDDPASDETDIEKIWEDFEGKMKKVMEEL